MYYQIMMSHLKGVRKKLFDKILFFLYFLFYPIYIAYHIYYISIISLSYCIPSCHILVILNSAFLLSFFLSFSGRGAGSTGGKFVLIRDFRMYTVDDNPCLSRYVKDTDRRIDRDTGSRQKDQQIDREIDRQTDRRGDRLSQTDSRR